MARSAGELMVSSVHSPLGGDSRPERALTRPRCQRARWDHRLHHRAGHELGDKSMKETDLTGIVAEHIDAINAADTDRAVATFALDAYVNDNHREFVGIDAIRRWLAKEIVGEKVTIEA